MGIVDYKQEICCIIGRIDNENVLRYIFIIVSNIANEIESYEKTVDEVCDRSLSA